MTASPNHTAISIISRKTNFITEIKHNAIWDLLFEQETWTLTILYLFSNGFLFGANSNIFFLSTEEIHLKQQIRNIKQEGKIQKNPAEKFMTKRLDAFIISLLKDIKEDHN